MSGCQKALLILLAILFELCFYFKHKETEDSPGEKKGCLQRGESDFHSLVSISLSHRLLRKSSSLPKVLQLIMR